MKVIVVGAGIAGLGAAWRLRENGAEVTLVESDSEVGGRCRTHYWQDGWRVRGAFAFVGTEDNLIEQSKALGIYKPDGLTNLTEAHEQYLLHHVKGIVRQPSFSPADILRNPLLSIGEKASLAKMLPSLAKQIGRNDPRDLTSASALDTESAYDFMKRISPNFADYILEPTMQMFCGYEKDDYSVAWLMWLMASFPWSGSWWSFKERGVGMLTYAMGQHFEKDAGCEVLLGSRVVDVTKADKVRATILQGETTRKIEADAVIFAVPAPLVPKMMPTLDDERLNFLRSVGYVGHHIVHYLFDAQMDELPPSLLLPTKDGFERVSNLHFWRKGNNRFLASGELKGAFCASTLGESEDAILDQAWDDYARVEPKIANAVFVDRHLQRNDLAICRREAGFVKRLAAFRQMPDLPGIAFAGDYMINSTVGQSHWSGLQAADNILGGSRNASGAVDRKLGVSR
ncbi:protoporphyrinogen/coproporphyrinogen oxidase [Phyllobacterium zundukense]|nr:FAD-dependent oxidoreductase [Phyllobacterium zundukense]ATU95470.1 hypothetical protein BLM14_27720 [Phyllobacterium zundukense]